MKISEMNTDQLAACLCKIATPIGNMMGNEETVAIFKLFEKKKMVMLEQVAILTGKLIPHLLIKHKKDMYTVIAALTGKDEKEVAEQNGLKTLLDCKECFDMELIRVFRSAAVTGKKE